MRSRRNREISIFSMSALDLFASALGAFLILMIIMFPYYKKETDSLKKLNESQQALGTCKEESNRQQHNLAQCKEKLAASMLLVSMSWEADRGGHDEDGGADVDLHVTDPEGYVYWYKKSNSPTGSDYPTQARISLDITHTPGYEVFEEPRIRSGTYGIAMQLYGAGTSSGPIKVRLKIYTVNGITEVPVIILHPESDLKRMMPVATVTVGGQGDIQVHLTQ